MSDPDDYQPVACSFYDELGLRMMRGTPCRLVVEANDGRDVVEMQIEDSTPRTTPSTFGWRRVARFGLTGLWKWTTLSEKPPDERPESAVYETFVA